MPDLPCRLAKLEEQMDTIKESVTTTSGKLDTLHDMLMDVRTEMTKKQAFLAGAAATCSVIWGVVWYLWEKFGGSIAAGAGVLAFVVIKTSRYFA